MLTNFYLQVVKRIRLICILYSIHGVAACFIFSVSDYW